MWNCCSMISDTSTTHSLYCACLWHWNLPLTRVGDVVNPDLQHLVQNRAGRRQFFLRTLTLSVQFFHGDLKRLHVLNPCVHIFFFC